MLSTAQIRVGALVMLALLAAYFGLRAVAAQCSGTRCDISIPLSLLVPIAVLTTGAITGLLAISAAGRGARHAQDALTRRRQ
jgi:hypothetical protein